MNVPRQLASALGFFARCHWRGVQTADELYRYVEMTGGLRVLSGLFCGMKYVRHSSGSTWAPKILGTYEKEIAHLFKSQHLRSYDAVVDVGCAEGYYLAGFGYLASKCGHKMELIGYDTSERAVTIANYLLLVNGLSASIRRQRFSFGERHAKQCLVIVDIEGDEEELFRDFQGECWALSDFLVEIHDQPNASSRLDFVISRLAPTHDITVVHRRERSARDFPSHAVPARNDAKNALMNEYRQFGNKWIFAASRLPSHGS